MAGVVRARKVPVVIGIVLASAALPPLLYWLYAGRAPSLTPQEALVRLNEPGSRYVLVDVRQPESFAKAHLSGSVSWPLDNIESLPGADDLPEPLRGRSLILICDGGPSSALGALRLRTLGLAEVFSVRGGLQSWIAQASAVEPFAPMMDLPGGEVGRPAYRELPRTKQLLLVVSLYLVKPTYMLASLWLWYVLRKHRGGPSLAMRWSLLSFFVGEMACWVNFQFLREESAALEYVHSFSMVLFIALLTWSLIEAVDERILRYSAGDAKCIMLGHCRGCRKYSDVPCVLKRMFWLGSVSLAALALIPLTAIPNPVSYNSSIFGFVRNLMHPAAIQLYEIRFAPLAAIAFLVGAFSVLLLARQEHEGWAKILLAAGVGHLGFSYLRLAFLSFFGGDVVWFASWEEWTELLMMAALAYALWALHIEVVPRLALPALKR